MNATMMDDDELREFSVLVSTYATVHRHGLSHIYGADLAYARLYRLLGVPRMRPAFDPTTDYTGYAHDVLTAVADNATIITSSHRSDPSDTPLSKLARTTYATITSESEN